MVENDWFERDFLYKFIFYLMCMDWYEKWYRRVGRYLFWFIRVILENCEVFMVFMVVRILIGVISVGDMNDFNEEYKYLE